MSNRPTKKRSSSARVQAAARANKSSNTPWIIGIGIMLVIGIALIVAVAGSSGSGSSADNITGRKDAPASLVAKTTKIPDSVYNTIGQGSAALPTAINGQSIAVNGKPQVLYVGAEYCPYCATERWAMLNALSRFGTFTGLKITNSSTTDQYPGTKTWSFYKSHYSSDYIVFTPVEQTDNTQRPLDSTTSAQSDILSKYDQPPYTSGPAGQPAIPFIYFDGSYLISGATYDVGLLQGKTWDQIAAALSDPQSSIAKGAIGAANTITATICLLTHDQPSSACSLPAIKSLSAKIEAQPKKGTKA